MSKRVSQLDLPYAPTRREPHVDSEEAVQYERRRVSRQLEPLEPSRHSSEVEHILRSRSAFQESATSQEQLRRHGSNSSTRPDVDNANEDRDRGPNQSTRLLQWYGPSVKFWITYINLTIDEGAHRDHLGTLPPYPFFRISLLTQHST